MIDHNDGSFLIFQLGFFRQIMKVHYDGSLLRFIKNVFLVNRKNLAFLQYLKILHKNAHNLNFLLKFLLKTSRTASIDQVHRGASFLSIMRILMKMYKHNYCE